MDWVAGSVEAYLNRWAVQRTGGVVTAPSSWLVPRLWRGRDAMLKVARIAEESRGGLHLKNTARRNCFCEIASCSVFHLHVHSPLVRLWAIVSTARYRDRMDKLRLRTGRLLLEAPSATDIEAITAACQDPEIQRWVPIPVPYALREAEEYVTAYSDSGWASGLGLHVGDQG